MRASFFSLVQPVYKSSDPGYKCLLSRETLPQIDSKLIGHLSPVLLCSALLPLPAPLQLFLTVVKHNCSNVATQKEGQYSLCMLYDNECLQSPSPKTKIYTGVDSIPLCRLTNFAKCFLDCLKFFKILKDV